MATRYGVQFEDLMAEVCREFGARLVRSWDREAEKEEVKRFVAEAVENFFKGTHATVTEKVVIASPVKAKAPSKKKAKAEPEPEAEIAVESPKKKGTKSKAPAKAKPKAKEVAKKTGDKPKCEATTAKGAPCSKCALDGEVFCSVHLKLKSSKKDGEEKKAAKDKGGKGITKKGKASPPKHSHGLTSPPLKEACDLCETHGMPFEVPEYEYEEEEKKKEKDDDEIEDPDFKLEEDDFDESGSETGSDDYEFDELD